MQPKAASNNGSNILIVGNTHLLFNVNRGDIKLGQLCLLFEAIWNIYSQFTQKTTLSVDVPSLEATWHARLPSLVVCGDFNFTPQCELYQWFHCGDFDFSTVSDARTKQLSGQHLMMDRTYKSDTAGHGGKGSTMAKCAHPKRDIICQESSVQKEMPKWLIDLRSSLGNSISRFTDDVAIWASSNGDGDLAPLSHDSSQRQCEFCTKLVCSDSRLFSDLLSTGILKRGCETCHRISRMLQHADDVHNVFRIPFRLRSAYCTPPPFEDGLCEPAFTAHHGWQTGCSDYIWYSTNELQVFGVCEIPSKDDICHSSVPNWLWRSSDHFDLIADFLRKEPADIAHLVSLETIKPVSQDESLNG